MEYIRMPESVISHAGIGAIIPCKQLNYLYKESFGSLDQYKKDILSFHGKLRDRLMVRNKGA